MANLEHLETHRTFEVTLPAGANPDTDALFGIGNALGWNIKDRPAVASDLIADPASSHQEITDDDLLDISTELWDEPIYGENAVQFIAEQIRVLNVWNRISTSRNRLQGEVTLWTRMALYAQDEDSTLQLACFSVPRADKNDRYVEGRIDQELRKIWPYTPYPFEVPTVTGGDTEPNSFNDNFTGTDWDLEPGAVTRVRLAHYARTSGIAHHALLGAVGKTHDVVNIAAGLKTVEDARQGK